VGEVGEVGELQVRMKGAPRSRSVGTVEDGVVHHTVDPMLQARRSSGLMRTHDSQASLAAMEHNHNLDLGGGGAGSDSSDDGDDDDSVEALDENGVEELLSSFGSSRHQSSSKTDGGDVERSLMDSMTSASTSTGILFTWSPETVSLIHRLVAGKSTPTVAGAEASGEESDSFMLKRKVILEGSSGSWDIPWMDRGGSDARVLVASASGAGKQKYQEDRFVSLARATTATKVATQVGKMEANLSAKMAAQANKLAMQMNQGLNGGDPPPAKTGILKMPSDRLRRCTKTQAHHQGKALDVTVNVNLKTTTEEEVALGTSHNPLKDVGYFAVYDGHSGHECSDFLQNNLHDCLLAQPSFGKIVQQIAAESGATTLLLNPRSEALDAMAGLLRKAFSETDKRFLEKAIGTDPLVRPLHSDGSTAVVALTIPCREAPRLKLRQRTSVNMIEHRLTEESIRRLSSDLRSSEGRSGRSLALSSGDESEPSMRIHVSAPPEGLTVNVKGSPHHQAQRHLAQRLLNGLNGDGAGGGAGGIQRFDSATHEMQQQRLTIGGQSKGTPAMPSSPVSSGAVAKRLLKGDGGEKKSPPRASDKTISKRSSLSDGPRARSGSGEIIYNPGPPSAAAPVSSSAVARRLLAGDTTSGGSGNGSRPPRVQRFDSATHFSSAEAREVVEKGGHGSEQSTKADVAEEGGSGGTAESTGDEAADAAERAALPPVMRPLVMVAHVGDSRAVLVRLGTAYAAQGPPLGDRRLNSQATGLMLSGPSVSGSSRSNSARSLMSSGESIPAAKQHTTYQDLAPYVWLHFIVVLCYNVTWLLYSTYRSV
jgi:serine/threonine protein phosphatase PrpC